MIKQLKQFTLNVVAGANVATIAVMLLAGYADHLNPVAWPRLSCLGLLFPVFLLLNLLFLFFWLMFKWRRGWIPIAGYLLAYVPINIYVPLSSPSEVPDGALKVMSYNVCGYGGNGKYPDTGFDTISHYIAREQPDIVCLQEDTDTWRRFVMARYGKTFAYNDTTVLNPGMPSINCLGIHTRFPILRKERLPYESQCNGSVAYFLKVGADTVVVINNHLEACHLNDEDRERYKTMLRGKMERDTARAESVLLIDKLAQAAVLRAPQADVVHDYVKRYSRRYPVIVCGDFNDSPISYSHRRIAEGLTDCFAATGRGVGLSYNQKGFFVRIDNILCSDHFQPYNCKIDSKMDASDHYPMVCWLKMRDNP